MQHEAILADAAEADLRHWLGDFQSRFNDNARARKLSTGWDRQIFVEPSDREAAYTLAITGAAVAEIREGGPNLPDDRLVTMRASDDVLRDIFSGHYNPSNALLDGLLEVYSDTRDKVKLEALAMVVWGM